MQATAWGIFSKSRGSAAFRPLLAGYPQDACGKACTPERICPERAFEKSPVWVVGASSGRDFRRDRPVWAAVSRLEGAPTASFGLFRCALKY